MGSIPTTSRDRYGAPIFLRFRFRGRIDEARGSGGETGPQGADAQRRRAKGDRRGREETLGGDQGKER
jgi:hypothetical protein